MKKRGRIALCMGLVWSVCFAARMASGEVPTNWNALVDEFLDQAFFRDSVPWTPRIRKSCSGKSAASC